MSDKQLRYWKGMSDKQCEFERSLILGDIAEHHFKMGKNALSGIVACRLYSEILKIKNVKKFIPLIKKRPIIGFCLASSVVHLYESRSLHNAFGSYFLQNEPQRSEIWLTEKENYIGDYAHLCPNNMPEKQFIKTIDEANPKNPLNIFGVLPFMIFRYFKNFKS